MNPLTGKVQIQHQQKINTKTPKKRKTAYSPVESPKVRRPKTDASETLSVQDKNETEGFPPLSQSKTKKTTPIQPQPSISSEQNTTKAEEKKANVSPIILRDITKWTNCANHLKEHKINYTRVRQADGGIKIYPTEVSDYSKIIKYLEHQKYPFHTFHLPEEKHLNIVIRGIPTNLSPDEVKQELETLG